LPAGDLLLWFNADSNDGREERALHAACPILAGRKIAVSLWIRGNFQVGKMERGEIFTFLIIFCMILINFFYFDLVTFF
jgi:hypothetical protein